MLIESKLYNSVCDVTGTGYDEFIYNPGAKYGYISEYTALSIIEDLMHEIDILNEKIEDLEQDVEDNYRPIKKEEQYEVSYRDFI